MLVLEKQFPLWGLIVVLNLHVLPALTKKKKSYTNLYKS